MGNPRPKRVLIVNAYLDDARRPTRRPTTVLKTLAPVVLAGAFHRDRVEVRLWDEQSSGPLHDRDLLGWPDLLVLTGLTAAFDRMLHLTAYARTQNKSVTVAAGGPPIRSLPRYSSQFFDYCCTGDVEQMREVITDVFGASYLADEMVPRYDLAYWLRFGHVESTRNCNFACSFCSMTAEGNAYVRYDLEVLRQQIRAGGKRRFLLFLDNNFYGNDRGHFLARLELIEEMKREGWFKAWGALVTSDFFLNPENLRLAHRAGCRALFCGIESFDSSTLSAFRKKQNTVLPQVDLIRTCIEQGVLLVYGLIADVATRSIQSISDELDFIISRPEMTLPTFVVLPIPFPRTPFFASMAEQGRLLPRTRLRDLDGTTLCIRPIDPVDRVGEFVRDLQSMRGRRLRVLKHALGFVRTYRRSLSSLQLGVATARDLSLLGLPSLVRSGTAPLRALLGQRTVHRTFISSTDVLDSLYTPAMPVDRHLRHYFEPTPLTDSDGRVVKHLADELLPLPSSQVPRSGTA